jgi:hypothetical protein
MLSRTAERGNDVDRAEHRALVAADNLPSYVLRDCDPPFSLNIGRKAVF